MQHQQAGQNISAVIMRGAEVGPICFLLSGSRSASTADAANGIMPYSIVGKLNGEAETIAQPTSGMPMIRS